MAYSPHSLGSNSTSPLPYLSPLPGVKHEPNTGMPTLGPRLVILEQPQERFRFRYESELGGTHGQLAGRSGADRRSFPTVKLEGFHRPATIRCELYTVEEGQVRSVPHVHSLQGRNCSRGMAEMRVDLENDFTASFQGLGIIHTAKKQMVDKITQRKLEEMQMREELSNPGHLWKPTERDQMEAREQASRESQRMNMNRVCLRFSAFIRNANIPQDICPPVFSDPIYNGKSAQTGELKIVQLSEAYSSCTGNKEIWLLVERVRKNDIRVRVYEEDESGQEIWSDYGRVIKCHHQYAIIFQTPPYRDKDLKSTVRVFIQLERPSDGCVSEPKSFQYTERDHRTTKRTASSMFDQPECSRMRMSEPGRETFQVPPPQQVHEGLRALSEAGWPDFRRSVAAGPLFGQQGQPQFPQIHHQQPAAGGRQVGFPTTEALSFPPVSHSTNPYTAAASSQVSPPQQQHQAHCSDVMHPGQDPFVSGHRVEDVISETIPVTVQQMAPVTSAGLPTSGGHFSLGTHPLSEQGLPMNVCPELNNIELGPEDVARMWGPAEMQELLETLDMGAVPDGPSNIPPSRYDRAPRGVAVRGIQAAQADSTATASGGDDLADQMAQLSVDPGTTKGNQKPTIDSLPPEVQLAYRNAESVMAYAATGSHAALLDSLRYLVGMENQDGDNALHAAALYNRFDAMSNLLEAISGLPADARLNIVNSSNASRQTPLHTAVLVGSVECVQLLLAAGAGVHLVEEGGNTAVHLAATRTSSEILLLLLQQPDARRLLQQTNYAGYNPLHLAVEAGQSGQVDTLCELGSDINARDDKEGRSPLHLAVEAGNLDMLRLLLKKRDIEVDAGTFADLTPLHLACKLANVRCVAALMAAGANPELTSLERRQAVGSGTESEEEEQQQEGDDGDEENDRLDAFMYAEACGDSQLEQVLRGRIRISLDPDEEGKEAVTAAPAAGPVRQAAAKKDVMDSGMDSGLGITQDLTSADPMTSSSSAVTSSPVAGRMSDADERRLAALLDPPSDAWRTLAQLLELDVSTVEKEVSPIKYILGCIAKYKTLNMSMLCDMLSVLSQDEARQIVSRYVDQ